MTKNKKKNISDFNLTSPGKECLNSQLLRHMKQRVCIKQTAN